MTAREKSGPGQQESLWDFAGLASHLGPEAFRRVFVGLALLFAVIGIPIGVLRDLQEPSSLFPWQATVVNGGLGLVYLLLRNREFTLKIGVVVALLTAVVVLSALRNQSIAVDAVPRDVAIVFTFLAFGTLPALVIVFVTLVLPAAALLTSGVTIGLMDRTAVGVDLLVLLPVLLGFYALAIRVSRFERANTAKAEQTRAASLAASELVQLNAEDLRGPLVSIIQLAESTRLEDADREQLDEAIDRLQRRLGVLKELAELPSMDNAIEEVDVEQELREVFLQLVPGMTRINVGLLRRRFPLQAARFELNALRWRAAVISLIRGGATIPAVATIDLRPSVEVIDDQRVLLKLSFRVARHGKVKNRTDSVTSPDTLPESVIARSAENAGYVAPDNFAVLDLGETMASVEPRVRRWAEQSEGWLRLERDNTGAPGDQLVLTLAWPATITVQGKPRDPVFNSAPKVSVPRPNEQLLRGQRVLVVDDDPLVRRMTALLLRNKLGAIVDEASSGREAWQMFRKDRSYQLVLTDFVMPGEDGLQLLRNIRQIDAEVRVIVVTLSALLQDEVELVAAGANGVLKKPLREERLLELLQGLSLRADNGGAS